MTTPKKTTTRQRQKTTKPIVEAGVNLVKRGRPPGGFLQKTREAAARIIDGDVKGAVGKYGELDPSATPLDVLVQAMRDAYAIGGAMMAAPFAEKAAPYIHAKIANIEIKPPGSHPTNEDPKRLGLDKFLVEYVDVIDVDATEVKDADDQP